ncbi:MAG: hypothetical protein JEZ03_01645 [Bacteroidales bacterium]|nr:hypothetical protein [Bacteroidales bacterium]
MKFNLTIQYEDIFDGPKPILLDLISDIPSYTILGILSYMNSQLYLSDSIEYQGRILNILLQRQSQPSKYKVLSSIMDFKRKCSDQEYSIFSRLHIKKFIHFELLNFREFEIVDTTPEQELNFFKAYLIIATKDSSLSQEVYFNESRKNEGDFFPIYTWPMLIGQLDSTIIVNPFFNVLKAVCLLNYLQWDTSYSEYVIDFLKKNKQISSWDYCMSLYKAVELGWKRDEDGIKPYYIKCEENYKALYNNLSVDPKSYSCKKSEDNFNYLKLKAKPLFYHNEKYIVLDRNFIANKIYDGLIFDFYNTSGIKQEFKEFPDFKNLIGGEITEKVLFKRLLRLILDDKHGELYFFDKNNKGEPDAYFRKGKSIVLFEIKDLLFPERVILSNSYDEIEGEIDKKYNNKSKGTGQLLKQISKLTNISFEDRSYDQLNIKPRNLRVYPVIIYTDMHYGMPGVSNYLIKEFNSMIDDEGLRGSFKKINDLTFINLNFLIEYSKFLRNIDFIKILDELHQVIKRKKVKSDKYISTENLFSYNESIEVIFNNLYRVAKEDSLDTDELINALDLTRGLPEGKSKE